MSALPSTDFLDWLNTGERAGILDAAAIAYYQDSDYLYRVRINGDEYDLPVLAPAQWLSPDPSLDATFGEIREEDVREIDDTAVTERVKRIARGSGEKDPDPDDYLYNGDGFTPCIQDPATPTMDMATTDYFSKLSTDHRFREEFARALYRQGVSPTADMTAVGAKLTTEDLPNRTEFATDLPEILSNISTIPTPLGVNATTVFNTGDGYVLLLARRASNLMLYPDWWSNIPAGGIDPVDTGRPFETNLLKEYAEEVLGADEHGDPLAHPGVEALRTLLDDGRAQMDCTSVVLKPDRLELAVNALLFVDDPEYYEQFIESAEWTCFEHADVRFIDVADSEALADALHPGEAVPSMLPGVYEGLQRLESEYGVSVAMEIVRDAVPELDY